MGVGVEIGFVATAADDAFRVSSDSGAARAPNDDSCAPVTHIVMDTSSHKMMIWNGRLLVIATATMMQEPKTQEPKTRNEQGANNAAR